MQPYSLTIAETCRRYGFGKTTLYELIGAGKVDAVKQGARTLVLADSVERHLASLPRILRHSTSDKLGA
jgi:excisionase family DNA binding protein